MSDRPSHRLVRLARRAAERWASSLRLRVATTTLLLGVLAVVLLGAIIMSTIRDGLFESRREEVVAEAAARTELAQQRFDAATANTVPQVQSVANEVWATLQGPGSSAIGTMLLRAPDEEPQALFNEPVSDPRLLDEDLLSPELREEVNSGGQYWESVALPQELGGDPAIIVGSPVTMPIVGSYELYNVYSLAPEEGTLVLVARVLGAGAVVLLLLIGAMTWGITRQVLGPVRQAAEGAERLADGLLDERLDVRGNDELATLGRAFNDMAASLQDQIEQLAELSRLQQRFVSDVSHELRTPLTTIRMASEVLYTNREAYDPAMQRSAELLHAQLDRFESMLADLLEISRFDAGAAVLETEEQDLQDVVAHAVEVAAPLARAAGSTISVAGPGRPSTAAIDRRRVERIVRNLLVNAIEHGEGRRIDVTVGVDNTAAAVVVRDHGAGMTPAEAAHVFDRFWRADPARARTSGGTGLGLAISLEDAYLHGGWLEAWGEPEQGAAFRLTLPRRTDNVLVGSPAPLWPTAVRPGGTAMLPSADRDGLPDSEDRR